MVAGTLMLTDTINNSFDNIFAEANAGTDVTDPAEGGRGRLRRELRAARCPSRCSARSLRVDGVAEAAGGDLRLHDRDPRRRRKADRPAWGPPHIAASTVPGRSTRWTYARAAPRPATTRSCSTTSPPRRRTTSSASASRSPAPAASSEYTIVGIGEFGGGAPLGGASIAQFTLARGPAPDRQGGQVRRDRGRGGAGRLAGRAQAARSQACCPTRRRADRRGDRRPRTQDIKDGFSFLTIALLVFAGIALFVGGFLIFNTFSITVSQRTQEFGMLRTLGASARQVLATVLLEAVLIGLLASPLGIVGGIGFVALIEACSRRSASRCRRPGSSHREHGDHRARGRDGVDADLGARSRRCAPPGSRRSRRCARRRAATPTTRAARRRTVIAALLIARRARLSASACSGPTAGTRAPLLGLGLILLFIGVAMCRDRLVGPLAASSAGRSSACAA